MWTNTCCSHPLSFEDEADEKNNIGQSLFFPVPRDASVLIELLLGIAGVRRAASRKLTHELGIKFQDYTLDDLVYLTRIHYYAKSDDVWAEHESQSSFQLVSKPRSSQNRD